MYKKQKKSFDEVLDIAVSDLMRGKSVEDILTSFPEHADELSSALLASKNLMSFKNAVPNPDILSSALSKAPDFYLPQKRTVSLASMRINWKIMAPVAMFAVLALAFVFNGDKKILTPTNEEQAMISEEPAVMKNDVGSVVFSEPIPEATGSADETVFALFKDMDQEFSALSSEADAEILAAQNESNELDGFTYAESEI